MTTTEVQNAIQEQINWLKNPDFKIAISSTVDDYIDQIETSFAESVDPDGQPWQAIEYRQVPPPPLMLSGELKDSVIADASAGTITETQYKTDGSALVDYADDQNFGRLNGIRVDYVGWVAKRYGIKVFRQYIDGHPARPFIGFGDEVIANAVKYGVEDSIAALAKPW